MTSKPKTNKTVYILGAGFSASAGIPTQGDLVERIYKLQHDNVHFSKTEQTKIDKWVKQFDKFLTEELCVKGKDEKLAYTLEDIYTPIDKCLIENVPFRGCSVNDLKDLRNNLNKLITLAIKTSIENEEKEIVKNEIVNKAEERSSPIRDIERFAEIVVEQSSHRVADQNKDTVSIITTNWDTLLDNAVYRLISASKKRSEPRAQMAKTNPLEKHFGVVDYCCYISSLDEFDDSIKPGLYALGKGGYNVKILKLHGSLNWLQCPKCQRLYVNFEKDDQKTNHIFKKNFCRHCERNFGLKKHPSHSLETNLIMPTFLKNLNNIQNKLIWQNAGIELSEADEIVFIGYSLPQADFEFKQLLSRMIRKDAKIRVYLTDNDDPQKNPKTKHLTAGYRYTNFFNGREPEIHYNGGFKSFLDDYTINNPTV